VIPITKSIDSIGNAPDGQPAQQVGQPWTDKFGRRRVPSQTFIDDDDREYHGEEAMRREDADIEETEQYNRQYVEGLTPAERTELDRYLRTRERLPRRAPAAASKQRTPAARPRERRDSGSRRASGRRSGSDPGGGDDPPPEPPGLRLGLVTAAQLVERLAAAGFGPRLQPASGAVPDVWTSGCPGHPETGSSLVVVGGGDPPLVACALCECELGDLLEEL
jgi:hypothetical protein